MTVRTYNSSRAGAVLDRLEADIDLWFVDICSRRNGRALPVLACAASLVPCATAAAVKAGNSETSSNSPPEIGA